MGEERRCTYATRGWGVHDERWTAALRSNGFTVTELSLERDHLSISDVRGELIESKDPVLAGPLDVTHGLIGVDAPLFGLSWGFDLVQANERNEDLAWITDLSGLIVDSQHTREVAVAAGMPTERVHTIPWGVDLTTFTPDGPRADLTDLGVSPGSKVIVSMRALEPLYRVEDIVRGFAQLASEFPGVHLVVGNDGSLRNQLEDLVRSLHLEDRVSFIGSLPEESLPELLRATDVYVTASEVDGSSVTLLQAMACGTAVVASNTPGNSEWTTSGATGLLFQVADPTELATTVGRLLNRTASETAAKLGSGARKVVEERADWARNSAQLAQILLTHP
jgi:glycosyltransferase involved in cell wall biosynthesis